MKTALNGHGGNIMAKLQDTEARLIAPTYDKLVQELKENHCVQSIFEWQREIDSDTQKQILKKAVGNKRVFVFPNFDSTGRYFVSVSKKDMLQTFGYQLDAVRNIANGISLEEDMEWAFVSWKGSKWVSFGSLFDITAKSWHFKNIIPNVNMSEVVVLPMVREVEWIFDPYSDKVWFANEKAKDEMVSAIGLREFKY